MPITITLSDTDHELLLKAFTQSKLRCAAIDTVLNLCDEAIRSLSSAPVEGSGAVNVHDYDDSPEYVPHNRGPDIIAVRSSDYYAANTPVDLR